MSYYDKKYEDPEKKDGDDAIVAVGAPDDLDRSDSAEGKGVEVPLEENETHEVKNDLNVTGEDLREAEEYARGLTMDRVKDILEKTLHIHEHDPNFPIAAINNAKEFLHNPDVIANPEKHAQLVHEMFIEAALIENSSPYAEVRAVVSNTDDPTLPVCTVRMWTIGVIYVVIGAFINQLFSIRQPAIYVGSNVAQLLAYPAGKGWEKIMPDWGVTVFGNRISLNPGPFNKKEHMLITIMATVGFSTPYTGNIILTQYLPQYYNQSYAGQFSYQILLTLSINFIGYGLAGLLRRFLVNPIYAVWPTSLVTIALNQALHSGNDTTPVQGPWGLVLRASRMKCFTIMFVGMFVYFWFPSYLFQALSIFNWMSWIAPNNEVFNNIVGSNYGLGYNPISTFDWNLLLTNFDPLVVPAFNTINATIGMALTGFMILAIYYTNSWNSGYLPINSNKTFNRNGTLYDILQIIDDRGIFDQEKYNNYSPAYMAAGNINVYFWFFAAYAAVASYAFLYHRKEIMMGVRNMFKKGKRTDLFNDVHNRLMSVYPDVSEWWYFATLCVALICGCCGIGLWETYTTPAVVVYGIVLCVLCVVPIGIIKSITGLEVTLNVLAEFVGGSWVAGNALAMNFFKSFGYVTCAHALAFANDLKLAHYTKIPPRATFIAQMVATLVSSFVCAGVFNFQLNKIENVCTQDASFKMTCPGINTFFTASVFWGTLGPHRMFGTNGQYKLLLIGFPVGFILPIIFYFAMKKFPRQTWLRQIHPIPLIYGGIYWAPYSLTYQYPAIYPAIFSMIYLKKRFLAFWSRYNYVVSAAFSTAIAIAAVVIFFGLQIPQVEVEWWGNTVLYEGCEGVACRHLKIPAGGFGPGVGQFS